MSLISLTIDRFLVVFCPLGPPWPNPLPHNRYSSSPIGIYGKFSLIAQDFAHFTIGTQATQSQKVNVKTAQIFFLLAKNLAHNATGTTVLIAE